MSNCSRVGNGNNYKMAREQTRPNGMTAEPRDNETTRDEGEEAHRMEKGPGDVSNVSWATGKFFFFLFSFHLTFTNNILGTDPTYGEKGHDEKMTKRTRHPALPTMAASNCLWHGNGEQTTRTPKQQQDHHHCHSTQLPP